MKRLVLLLPLVTGCAWLQQFLAGGFQQPSLAFKEARLSAVDFEGAELDLVFTVTNPNPVGIDLARASYALEIQGRPVASGAAPNGLQIAAHGSSDAIFPARIHWSSVAPTLQALFTQDTVPYKASGELGLDTPVGVVSLPLSHEGTFAPPRAPKFELGSPRIESMGLTSARLTVPLQVTNPNAFPIPSSSGGGNLSIAGAMVAKVAASQLPPVPAGGSATVPFAVDVQFLESGLAVAEAIRSGQAELKLDGSLVAAGANLPFNLAKTVTLQR